MRSLEWSHQIDWCFYKKVKFGHRDRQAQREDNMMIQEKTPCGDEDRDCCNASTIQRLPRTPNKLPEARREAWNNLPQSLQK